MQTDKEEVISLPGHKRVSSLKEPTVSSDDSIVKALPSNILPADKIDDLPQLPSYIRARDAVDDTQSKHSALQLQKPNNCEPAFQYVPIAH